MSWKVFEEDCPELAKQGFERLNRKIAYLATIKMDGSPRLHPVTPFVGDGMMFMFTEPSSPKIRDLRRDGRYAIHCSVTRESPLFEFLVMGTAEPIDCHDERRELARRLANSPVVTDQYALFEFQIDRVLVVTYDEDLKPVIRRWRRQKGLSS